MKPLSFTRLLMLCLLLATNWFSSNAQSIYAYGYNFTASSKTFNYLTGGTPITAIQVDDNYTSIPIGFTFRFCGVDYSDVTVCSNGWLRFGIGAGTSFANWNYNDQVNSGIQPCVYALYEDVSGDYGTSLYQVSGIAPNRVFTWECRNWLWDYAATSPSVSFQVKLYETTNIIEILYKEESGTVQLNTSGGATIGIAQSGTDWQVLDNASSSPTSSSSTYTYNIGARPVTGQSYQWDPGPPCNSPAPITIPNIASRGATVSWAAVPGTGTYEYIVNTTSTDPTVAGTTTSLTTATISGLAPSTNYYAHVRYKCSPVSYSPWVTLSFTTRPDCSTPGKLIVNTIDTNSASLQWNTTVTATGYQYLIDNQRTPPATSTGVITSTTAFISLTGLTEGTWYYIHYRSLCAGNDSSSWLLDSFRTPVPCRRPLLALSTLTANNSVVSWSAVNTAVSYEYFLSTTNAEPTLGTPIKTYSVQTPYLQPKTQYYLFVRCNCEDYKVKSNSPWSLIDFVTPPALGISNMTSANSVLSIYPNPARENLQVDIAGKYSSNAQLQITNIAGKVLIDKAVNSNSMKIDITTLAPGVYMLRLADEENSTIVRFTKQ